MEDNNDDNNKDVKNSVKTISIIIMIIGIVVGLFFIIYALIGLYNHSYISSEPVYVDGSDFSVLAGAFKIIGLMANIILGYFIMGTGILIFGAIWIVYGIVKLITSKNKKDKDKDDDNYEL